MCYLEQTNWRKESEGLCSQVTIETDSISQMSGTGIPTFPLCRPSLSGSCILAFLLSHGYSLTLIHPLAFSCSPIIYSSCSFLTIFQARDPWSILWELLIEELVGRYTLPPLHASYRGRKAVSIEVASSSSGRLWQRLSRKNINPPPLSPLDQHKQGPEDSRTVFYKCGGWFASERWQKSYSKLSKSSMHKCKDTVTGKAKVPDPLTQLGVLVLSWLLYLYLLIL